MKNYHITANNSALEIPSAAKFNALTFRVIEMFRRGGGDVTTRTHLGRSWVKGRGDVRCGADFHEK